ncbi:MAG: adenosylcobalamin-dependent ribonucleoside-diphosphate reductase [Deinococcales bacterium]
MTTHHFDEHAQSIAKRQYMQARDEDIFGMFRRVSSWVSSAESPELRQKWGDVFYDLMASKRFCPGGRVLAGAGTQHGNVLNCFVQGATAHDPSSFLGVMEVAKKLALVTKVGGGNGVNLDVYPPRADTSRRDNGVRGWVYMSAAHADVEDFIKGLMRPPTMPDGDKVPTIIRNWSKAVYGVTSPALATLARQYGVALVATQPDNVREIQDDMGGILDAAKWVCEQAKAGLEPRIDLSGLRAEGALIKGSGGTSSGPVSFLFEIFDNFLEWANLGAEASGPVATLRYCYAPVLRVVRQGGTRRGAGMATISIDHPDVLDFLTAKDLDRESGEGDISTFNISILCTEKFWHTLQADGLWNIAPLEVMAKYHIVKLEGSYEGTIPELPTRDLDGAKAVPLYAGGIPAKWLWRQIAEHAWSTGEPGLIFIDRVNEKSAIKDLGERYQIKSTNPCGEIPLTVGEPCDLGAINLAAYVQNRQFDYTTFRQDVRYCVRFLDDVLDVNVFALEDNRIASQNLRRLGLGVMGLADALILMGQRYDSQEGRDTIHKIMSAMREEAVSESQNLGLERGVYPIFEQYSEKIPHAPRRNVAVLTVAPTGTTSMLMGVSSGIEPVFSPFIWRKIGAEYKALIAPLFQELLEQYPVHAAYSKNGAWDWDKVTDAIANNHGSCVGLEFVPEAVQRVFVCAHDIAPLDHVRMQGVVQKAFDAEGFAANSLSKTINLPNHAAVEDVEAAYSEAYRTGCKGITVYRDGSRQFQVLSTSKEEKKEEHALEPAVVSTPNSSIDETLWGASQHYQPEQPIFSRPNRLTGVTDMVKLTDLAAGTKRTFLITTNTLEGKPVEIVVVSGRAGDEANADSEALGRVVSIALQYGVPAEAIQKTLRGINGGLYGSYNGRLVASKADLIAVALESTQSNGAVRPAEQPLLYNMQGGYPPVAGAAPSAEELQAPLFAKPQMKGEQCPSCGNPNLVREEGCLKCQSCGYSKCG